jgi:NTE family protein
MDKVKKALTPADPLRRRPKVALALQGGGAHGAYGWGVLDRLLELDCFDIQAVSGTSAGAINGALLASGLADGPETARELLSKLWQRTVNAAAMSPLLPSPIDRLFGNGDLNFSLGYQVMGYLARLMSPQQFNPLLNPLDVNPLRDLLRGLIDFDKLKSSTAPRLYVAAVQVSTGQLRIFDSDEITTESLLASACLPFMFQPIVIDGQGYWDGGYLANPALSPLTDRAGATDVIVVQVTPFGYRPEPMNATDLFDRISEISFNGALLRELHAIERHNELVATGKMVPGHAQPIHLHMIPAGEAMRGFTASSKLNVERGFIEKLFRLGRDAADHWLDQNFANVGIASTLQLDVPLECGPEASGGEAGSQGFAA